MATYKKGILGVFSGKVGTVVGSSWKGIHYMRSLPKASGKAATPLQRDQRIKFALVTGFLKPIKHIANIGYQSVAGSLSPFNSIVSHHLSNAVTGTSPNFEIDYPRVVFSRGELPGISNPQLNAVTGYALAISWQDNSQANLAKPDDKAIVLVYNSMVGEFIIDDLALRQDGSLNLSLPASYVGHTVQVWMAFFAADHKLVSTSVYLGAAVIS
ncbi:DUF6266 family protein [Pedobacter helvus]|uniref:DUF6266 family protein n=1 Tax=Pedobacter helvus TaxID=2563444 RepID=A0ABW9JIP6_9SPHI|nr:DUF6266 family protein [Pedobacter ureilyticus]